MLVLSRRAGESVVLGDDVVVTILELEETNRQAASPSEDVIANLARALDHGADPSS